jgi:hypothetical protein
MFRHNERFSRWLAAAIAAAALTVPATSAAYPDYLNPDNGGPGIESYRGQPGYQDLRNPDSRAPSNPAQTGEVSGTSTPPLIATEPGFDWGDAGIGAGSVLALVLIALAAMFAVVHRRSRGAEA